MLFTDNRIGTFTLGRDVIEENPEIVRKIMGEVIVIRAEFIAAADYVEYHAICKGFEAVEEDGAVPSYEVMYDTESDKVSWAKEEG